MMKKQIEINNKQEIWIKIILILSCPFFTILLSNRFDIKHILIGAILSFFIFIYISMRKITIKSIDKCKLIVSIIIALYMIKRLLTYSVSNIILLDTIFNKLFGIHLSTNLILKLLGLIAIPITIYFIYLFIDKILPIVKKFISSFTKVEKMYLKIVCMSALILSIVVTHYTTAFTKPMNNDVFQDVNVIYTSDSGKLVAGDTYFNVSFSENDIRQPLFGIFSLPFAVPARMISEICFFLTPNYEYEIIMTIIQFILIAITTIMISRMMNLEEHDKKYLYLLFSCSFPYIVFSFVLEQYVIGLFYLITTLYVHQKYPNKTNFTYIGAVGTMITSGVIFPAITRFKNFRQWIKSIWKCFFAFVSILIIGGQFPQVLTIVEKVKSLMKYTGHQLTFMDKWNQFTHFIKGLFLAIPGKMTIIHENRPSYQLLSIETISIIGIVILFICLISFFLNRKQEISKISMLWIGFSIFILLIIGWGTQENGLILYSLYFAWAYLVLYFLLIKKLLKNNILFKIGIAASCFVMLYFNISEFIEIIKFALKYY